MIEKFHDGDQISQICVRLSATLHQRCLDAAADAGKSLNRFCVDAIVAKLERARESPLTARGICGECGEPARIEIAARVGSNVRKWAPGEFDDG